MNFSDLLNEQHINFCFQNLNNSCIRINRPVSTNWALYIVMFVTIILTIAGNLMVIISVSHFTQLHTPTNFLILSLAITDFLLGLIIMPYSMVRSVTSCWYFGDIFCKLHSGLDMMLCTTSIFHLFFISVDRYYAICHPLNYYRKITIPLIKVFLFVCWSVPSLYSFGLVLSNINIEGIENYIATRTCIGSCTLVFNEFWGTISSLISFFVPGFLMIGIYSHIFSIARKQAKAISKNTNPLCEKKSTSRRTYVNIENKAARTLSLVMAAFILCWLPFFAVTVIDPYVYFSTSEDAYNAVLWLGYFNSTLNPIIYALFYPWFKKAFGCIITAKIFNIGSASIQIITGV